MTTERLDAIYDAIDRKFENMSEEELREYEEKTDYQIQKYSGKRLDQLKRQGYLRAHR